MADFQHDKTESTFVHFFPLRSLFRQIPSESSSVSFSIMTEKTRIPICGETKMVLKLKGAVTAISCLLASENCHLSREKNIGT